MSKAKKIAKRWVIVGNGSYGLWFGHIKSTDAEVVKNKSVRLYEARNIRYWHGKTGGVTSLAAFGLCGPRMAESRIGATIASTLLLDVAAIHECSAEAVESFARFVTQ
jgi:hypothetical protein